MKKQGSEGSKSHTSMKAVCSVQFAVWSATLQFEGCNIHIFINTNRNHMHIHTLSFTKYTRNWYYLYTLWVQPLNFSYWNEKLRYWKRYWNHVRVPVPKWLRSRPLVFTKPLRHNNHPFTTTTSLLWIILHPYPSPKLRRQTTTRRDPTPRHLGPRTIPMNRVVVVSCRSSTTQQKKGQNAVQEEEIPDNIYGMESTNWGAVNTKFNFF